MAYPGGIKQGDTVRWRPYADRMGIVVGCSEDGSLIDVRFAVDPWMPAPESRTIMRRIHVARLEVMCYRGDS